MFKKVLLFLKNKLSGSAIGTTPVPRRVFCLTSYVSDISPINLYSNNEHSKELYITNNLSVEVNDGC